MAFKSYEKRTTKTIKYMKEVRKLYRNITKRMGNIEKTFPNSPLKEQLRKRIGAYAEGFNMRLMSNKEIKGLRDELFDFNTKDYSYVRGYKEFNTKILEPLNELGIEYVEKVWQLFDKFKSEMAIRLEVKYQVVGQMIEYIKQGYNDEQIRDRIDMLLRANEETNIDIETLGEDLSNYEATLNTIDSQAFSYEDFIKRY